jgi:hypothetical protein
VMEKDVNVSSDLQTATKHVWVGDHTVVVTSTNMDRNKVLSYFRRIQQCLLYLLIRDFLLNPAEGKCVYSVLFCTS